MLGFIIKWVGVIVVAFLVYHFMSSAGLDKGVLLVVAGMKLTLASIGGWLAFFLGAGVTVKS